MTTPHGPWVSKLIALLGEVPSDTPPEPPPIELPAPVRERLARASELCELAGKLIESVATQFTLLHAACLEAGLMRGERVSVHPQLQRFIPTFVTLLKDQPDAARLVLTLVPRYLDAVAEHNELRRLVELGQLADLDLDKSRGKFHLLDKVRHYFKDYPLLVQLFAAPPVVPAPAPAAAKGGARSLPAVTGRRTAAPTAPIKSGTDVFVSGATRPLAPRPARGGTEQLSITGRAAPRPPAPVRPPDQHEVVRLMVRRLEVQATILDAALALAVAGTGEKLERLPPPLQITARHLAAQLGATPATLASVKVLLADFRTLQAAARQMPPDRTPVVRALSSLRDAPRRYQDVPVLGTLLAAS